MLQQLVSGLQKTRNKLSLETFKGGFDAAVLTAIEDQLLSADVGLETTDYIIEALKKEKGIDIQDALRKVLRAIFYEANQTRDINNVTDTDALVVVLVYGVNGAGKTTTIGKLSTMWGAYEQVLVASADTFRAAAHQQLKEWADRADVSVWIDEKCQDPAAVAYASLESARARGYQRLIIDTAGRQFNQKHLMDELNKIYRSVKKQGDVWPQHCWLVIDAGSGQNGFKQAEAFAASVPVTGVIVTKLDGSAKGGVVLSLAHRLGLPIMYIGVGEAADDLLPFDADQFVTALLESR